MAKLNQLCLVPGDVSQTRVDQRVMDIPQLVGESVVAAFRLIAERRDHFVAYTERAADVWPVADHIQEPVAC
ncbi:hypothetical protein HKX41_01795 [Salinisphaera sp. USBA-960]|nr:hypothetical protein [Salifodinibacter halophilus]